MVHPVETLLQVDVYHPRVACPGGRLRLPHRLVGTALWAKAVAPLGARRVPFLLQHLQEGVLDAPVEHGRDTQVAGPAPRLWDGRPPDGLGGRGALHQGGSDHRPGCLQGRSQVVHGHPVDSWGTLVASDLVERAPEMLGLEPPLQQVRLLHRSVLSPCPSDGFIPWCVQGPLERPHGCLAPARHAATPPLLQAPLGAPFGPSAHPRGGSLDALLELTHLPRTRRPTDGMPWRHRLARRAHHVLHADSPRLLPHVRAHVRRSTGVPRGVGFLRHPPPVASAGDTSPLRVLSCGSTPRGASVPDRRVTLHVGPHASPGVSGVSRRRLQPRSALIRACWPSPIIRVGDFHRTAMPAWVQPRRIRLQRCSLGFPVGCRVTTCSPGVED